MKLRAVAFMALLGVMAGCGGSSKRDAWAAGQRLLDRPNLGRCATVRGPHGRVLIACHAETAAFTRTCWSPPTDKKVSLNSGFWTDASSDSDCEAAWRAANEAGLFAK